MTVYGGNVAHFKHALQSGLKVCVFLACPFSSNVSFVNTECMNHPLNSLFKYAHFKVNVPFKCERT